MHIIILTLNLVNDLNINAILFNTFINGIVNNNNIYIYNLLDKKYIKGNIYENAYDQNRKLVDDDFSVVLAIDSDYNSYFIYSVDNDYINVINGYRKINIDSNAYNRTEDSELISSEQICSIYLSDFINNIFNDYVDAYNLLSEDMKRVYTSIDDFENYIIDNF